MMKAVHPYLNFHGNTEEAFRFYRSVFGGEFEEVVRYRHLEMDMGVPAEDLDKVMHIALPLGNGTLLMGTDTLDCLGQKLVVGNSVTINLAVESEEEAQRVFTGLSDGGEVRMPLGRTEWAETFGTCTDRYGVHWMVNFAGSVSYVAPTG